MKKVIVLLSILLVSGGIFAQKANVSKAKNKALSTESPDFPGAREAIKLALEDPTTKDLANTWYVAGLIGYKENESLFFQAQMGQPVDEVKKGEAVMESIDYFLVADSLGQIPDAKGKISSRPRKDIQPKMLEYYQQLPLIQYGGYLFDQGNYKRAYEAFAKHLSIPEMAMLQNEKDQAKMPRDTTYLEFKYNKGLIAYNAEMYNEALETFKEMIDTEYDQSKVYQWLAHIYLTQKDTVNYVNTLQEGAQKLPAEPWFVQNLIQYFLDSEQNEEALLYLNTAIERMPDVAPYYYARGCVEEALEHMDAAKADFQKAIDLEPTMAQAYDGIGRVYYNSAVRMQDEANDLTNQRDYEDALVKVQETFKESLPYFLRASELAPDERDYKITLRQLYYRLGMDAEYDAISKELGM